MEIEACEVGHVVREEFSRYEFPTEVLVRRKPPSGRSAALETPRGQAQLKRALQAFLARRPHLVVYSAYGSPYECAYGPVSISKRGPSGTLTCLGRAVRRRATRRAAWPVGQPQQPGSRPVRALQMCVPPPPSPPPSICRRDIPTLGEVKAQERAERGVQSKRGAGARGAGESMVGGWRGPRKP